ncbi:MAG: hypothetical protein ACRC8S_10250 [Fimbriiglobus sp.]
MRPKLLAARELVPSNANEPGPQRASEVTELEVEVRFWELCDRATQHDEAHCRKAHRENAPDEEVFAEAQAFEQSMVEIIWFVEANPEHRKTFVRCFCDLVQWKRSSPMDLIAFCMRRLQFSEIPELIQRDSEAHGPMSAYSINHMAHWSSINHAYVDEVWESAWRFDFYRHEVADPENAASGT